MKVNEDKLLNAILDKLDQIQSDLHSIQIEQVILKTTMERNKEDNLPQRVDKLEIFQARLLGIGTVAMIVVPLLVRELFNMAFRGEV